MADTKATIVVSAEDRFSRTFAQLKRDIAAGQGQLAGMTAAAGLASSALARITFGAIGAGGFAAGVRQLANDLDNLNDVSASTGSTVENLSAIEDVARRNGGSLELVSASVLKLNKVLQEATPDSPMQRVLAGIGLNAAELRKQDPAKALQTIAVALAGYADDGDKARLVQELFGKSTKEVAKFLQDLAEAGELNGTVTKKQAEEAGRFNDELSKMSTNASNVGRAIVSEMLPAINSYLDRLERIRKGNSGSAFMQEIVSEVQSIRLRGVVNTIETLTDQLSRQPQNTTLANLLKEARDEYDKLSKAARIANQTLKETLGIEDPSAPKVATPAAPKRPIGDTSGLGGGARAVAAQRAQVSEAQRYLEALQRQGEKLDELTATQQLLRDIEKGRIDGLTPGIEKLLRLEAQRIDLAKQINAEKEREVGFQALLSGKAQRDINEGLSLLEQTPTGQRDRIERQSDQVLAIARQNPNDARIQAQAGEAITALREQLDQINAPVQKVATEFDKLADTIEKSMERSTDAVLDFILEGKGASSGLAKAFARDLLRDQIETPLRDTMKAASKAISNELSRIVSAPGGGIGGLLGGIFGGLSGGLSSLFGGFTGRAGGGGVKAGELVRWNENGREWFVPGSDGQVVNPAQQKAMGRSALILTYAPTIHANGDVSAQTVGLLQGMLAKNNQMLIRSMRTSGVFAQ